MIFIQAPLIPFLSFTTDSSHGYVIGRFWLQKALQRCFTNSLPAPGGTGTFHTFERPQLPSGESLTRAPWVHPALGTRPALAGVFRRA